MRISPRLRLKGVEDAILAIILFNRVPGNGAGLLPRELRTLFQKGLDFGLLPRFCLQRSIQRKLHHRKSSPCSFVFLVLVFATNGNTAALDPDAAIEGMHRRAIRFGALDKSDVFSSRN